MSAPRAACAGPLVLALVLSTTGCGRAARLGPEAPDRGPSPAEYRTPPPDLPGPRVELHHVAPGGLVAIPRWEAEQFGAPMPETTYRPGDQSAPPVRWDLGAPRSRGTDGLDETFVGYHGHGCCGGCQAVALLGAVLAQWRIEEGSPAPRRRSRPHRATLPGLEDELEIGVLLGVSRQALVFGGRDIPTVAPALAITGAPTRAAARPLLPDGRSTWLPARMCRALAGKGLPVLRARVREHDVRFMSVALQQGPVVISGAFNRLVRGEDGIYRCPPEPTGLSRHHFMLVVGFELSDRDGDGVDDEVLWLARDDYERQGGDDDTWEDPFLGDEWARIVPEGCLLDEGRAHSIIPGTVAAGTFDDPVLPGPGGLVSFCEADPDADGVPTIADTCPYTPDPDQVDADGDDLGDACDPCPTRAPEDPLDPGHADHDGDSIADECDPCPDEEGNGCETTGAADAPGPR